MSLARTVIRGVIWTTISSTIVRVLGIIGTLVIARELDQDGYGIVMNWSNLLMFASAMSTLGVGSYLLVYRNEPRDTTWHAVLIHLSLWLVALAIVFPLRDQLAAWTDTPTVMSYVVGFAISTTLDRVGYIPERLLTRQLKFVKVSNIKTIGEVLFTAVSVGCVLLGMGPIALVYGTLARSLYKCVLYIANVPLGDWLPFTPFSRAILRRVGSFGAKIWPQTFSGYAVTRADNFFVASYFGPATLVEYNLAYNFAEMPMIQVGEQMTDLLMPSFSALEPERQPDAVIRVLGLVCLIMFPLSIGLGAVANSLVAVAISRPEWAGMGPMLSILCGLSVFRPISGVLSSYLNARGRPGLTVMLEVFSLIVLLVLTPILGWNSPLIMCGVAVTAFALRALANIFVVAKLDGKSVFSYFAQIIGPTLASVPMVGAVLGTRWILGVAGVHSHWLTLILEVVAGGVAYVGSAFVFARSIAFDFIRTLKAAIARRRGGETPPTEGGAGEGAGDNAPMNPG